MIVGKKGKGQRLHYHTFKSSSDAVANAVIPRTTADEADRGL